MRIAVGGFHHETNTFAPTKASFEHFERDGGWPGLCRGEAVLSRTAGINLPMAGFVRAAGEFGDDLAPLVWANATPSAHVREDAYERIAAMLTGDLEAAGPVDAVYLDLHGAMVAEHCDDGEGELLGRVRQVVGNDVPIVASLDLHANVTPEMIDFADLLVAFRTYPHVDMAETGARAARLLREVAEDGWPVGSWRQVPFLIPITSQCTLVEPMKGIYGRLDAIEAVPGMMSASITGGFPLADTPHCGPSILVYGADPSDTEAAAADLLEAFEAARPDFSGGLLPAAEAVAEALRHDGPGPVVIADTCDNPGGGGDGDTTGLLRELVAQKARGAVLGLLIDPEAARMAHESGEGRIRLALGGRSGIPGDAPLETDATVRRLGDGEFTCTGPMYSGSRMRLGPMALLEIEEGVLVAVSSRTVQMADRDMFRHLGVEPEAAPILALKSSVHFRADFEPIAARVLVAVAPGPVAADPSRLAFSRLRADVDLAP